MKIKKIIPYSLLLVFFISLISISPISSDQPSLEFELDIFPQDTKSWTFMLYLCADTRDDIVGRGLNNSANWCNSNMFSMMNSLVDTD
ncbi:MAG: hypothetical protein FK730_08800, partial [Asgard group archaeon]|nr:hypothetical protein [Asgard group archaeon]